MHSLCKTAMYFRLLVSTYTDSTGLGRRKALQAAGSMSEGATRASNSVAGTLLVPCWNEERQTVFYLAASRAWALNHGGTAVFNEKAPPPTRLMFPLSADHLITLVQINALRACHTNAHLLSRLRPDTSSYDCTNGTLRTVPQIEGSGHVPPTLMPTRTQTAIPHEPWIDVFPHPLWRDNLIEALGAFEADELCSDIVGGLFEDGVNAECERRGVIVWSPPWHYEGWELSEGFVRKWGWTLRGCHGILEARNKWRRTRGERPLTWRSEDR